MIKGYEYDEFGSLEQRGATDFLNEVTFTGSVTDTSSGLQYMNARYYQPSTGRFISQDSYTGNPYDPWTQHLYSYCMNNPTNFIDPTGHESTLDSYEYQRRMRDRENQDDKDDHGHYNFVAGQWEPAGYKDYEIRIDQPDSESGWPQRPDAHIRRGSDKGYESRYHPPYPGGKPRHEGKPWPKKLTEKLKEKGIWPPKDKDKKSKSIIPPKPVPQVVPEQVPQKDYWGAGAVVLGCAVVIAILVIDDATVVGIADDPLIPVFGGILADKVVYMLG